jgi:hypothetical protein
MSTTSAQASPTAAADPSLTRLHLMRSGYLLPVVGLALKEWPLVPDAHTMPLYEGVTLCRKLLWLGMVALPKTIEGNLGKATSDIEFNCSFVVLILAVIPWGYVWRTYVRASGDRWR